MSCRVLERGVEAACLNLLAEEARQRGAKALIGEFIPSERNGLVEQHYQRLGFAFVSERGGSRYYALRLDGFAPLATEVQVADQPSCGAETNQLRRRHG